MMSGWPGEDPDAICIGDSTESFHPSAASGTTNDTVDMLTSVVVMPAERGLTATGPPHPCGCVVVTVTVMGAPENQTEAHDWVWS